MGMSFAYGTPDHDEAVATIAEALDLGVTFFDTADMYGFGHNEELVGKALAGRRDEVVLATKFGIHLDPDAPGGRGVRGDAAYVRQACDASLGRLGLDHIDLYYQHRPDVTVPIEETVGRHGRAGRGGQGPPPRPVRGVGRHPPPGAAVHPIAALQSEWSLFSRDIEDEIVPTCRELGIGLVPYSPLGRGLLTGAVASLDDLQDDDFRRTVPALPGRQPRPQPRPRWRWCARSPPRTGRPPGRWPSPGWRRRATTWCRSPARSAAATWRRTSAPLDLTLTADDLARLDALDPGRRADGPAQLDQPRHAAAGLSTPPTGPLHACW